MSVRISNLWAEIEPGTSRIRSRSFNHSNTTCGDIDNHVKYGTTVSATNVQYLRCSLEYEPDDDHVDRNVVLHRKTLEYIVLIRCVKITRNNETNVRVYRFCLVCYLVR
jgi:hypothetical protein